MDLGVESPPAPAASSPSLTGRSLPTARSPGDPGLQEGGVVEELAAWLAGGQSVYEPDREYPGWEFDWFYTLTFDPIDKLRNLNGQQVVRHRSMSATNTTLGWSRTDRYFREWIQVIEERNPRQVFWTRSREWNPNHEGGTHFHGLIGGVGTQRRHAAWAAWFYPHGVARIEPIAGVRNREAVARYVSKYVLKDQGEMVMSPNLGAFQKQGGPS